MSLLIDTGSSLTVKHELFGDDGAIVLAENQKVKVREVIIFEAHWSRLCPDIWIDDEIIGICLEGINGIFKPNTFIEYDFQNNISRTNS